jgi:general secretion pathway protein G
MRIQDAGFGMRDSDGVAEGFSVSQIQNPESSRGFTLFEFIVVIIIISILIEETLRRVPFYQEQAEKTVMEQTVAGMQSALVMRTGSLMAQGAAREAGMSKLASENPINWLQQKPQNYAGEFFDPSTGAVKPGSWVFDLKSHDLIYVPSRNEYFTPGTDGQKWVRFHVKIEYDRPAASSVSTTRAVVATLFEPTAEYHWFD